jgi:membrane protease YdiL (CAAX protease family)
MVKHPAAAYFALTFAISWGGSLLAIGGMQPLTGTAPTNDPRFVYALIAMLLGPSLSGLLLTVIVHGRDGLRDLLARVVKWRVASRWYAVALLAAPVLWGVTLLALSLVSPKFLSGIVTSADKSTLVAVGLAVAVSAGIFEEIGWTGFAIPHLLRRHGVFATGVVVGVLWSAWHVLVSIVWAAPATAGDLPIAVFLIWSIIGNPVGYLTAFRVLMVWVYDRTGSVLIAMLMHVSVTASVLILDPAALSGTAALIYAFSVAAVVWAAVAVVVITHGRHRARQPADRGTLAA